MYGRDLRDAVKINLLLHGDVHESKRQKYVDRHSKTNRHAVAETKKIASAVFNSFGLSVYKELLQDGEEDGIEYQPSGCTITDFPDLTEAEIELRNLDNSLV